VSGLRTGRLCGRIISALAVTSPLLVGCVTSLRTYPGPQRDDDMVAALRASADTAMIHVDGRHIGPAVSRVELLAGEHAVGFTHRWHEGRRVIQGDLVTKHFDAEAGHTYELRGRVGFPGHWFGSVVDVSQGTTVSYP
jgi:hypothetical protein